MIVVHGETLWSPAPQPMDDDDGENHAREHGKRVVFQEEARTGSGLV